MHSTTLPFCLPLPSDLPCAFDLGALAAHVSTVVDQRDPRGVRYPLAPLLALAVCAKLAGHSRIAALADWARLRAAELADLFGLSRATMPHPTTWSRLFAEAVDVSALEQALGSFFHATLATAEVPARGSIMLAVDGKTLRGTIPSGQTAGVHLVAAYLPERGVVLAQLAVDHKENEIVVVPTLLTQLDLTGWSSSVTRCRPNGTSVSRSLKRVAIICGSSKIINRPSVLTSNASLPGAGARWHSGGTDRFHHGAAA